MLSKLTKRPKLNENLKVAFSLLFQRRKICVYVDCINREHIQLRKCPFTIPPIIWILVTCLPGPNEYSHDICRPLLLNHDVTISGRSVSRLCHRECSFLVGLWKKCQIRHRHHGRNQPQRTSTSGRFQRIFWSSRFDVSPLHSVSLTSPIRYVKSSVPSTFPKWIHQKQDQRTEYTFWITCSWNLEPDPAEIRLLEIEKILDQNTLKSPTMLGWRNQGESSRRASSRIEASDHSRSKSKGYR